MIDDYQLILDRKNSIRSFVFMELPGELRNEIYDLVLVRPLLRLRPAATNNSHAGTAMVAPNNGSVGERRILLHDNTVGNFIRLQTVSG